MAELVSDKLTGQMKKKNLNSSQRGIREAVLAVQDRGLGQCQRVMGTLDLGEEQSRLATAAVEEALICAVMDACDVVALDMATKLEAAKGYGEGEETGGSCEEAQCRCDRQLRKALAGVLHEVGIVEELAVAVAAGMQQVRRRALTAYGVALQQSTIAWWMHDPS